ncbi:MAG: hypothetical protein ACRD4P_06940 [Bryobacteraceae bacterium]
MTRREWVTTAAGAALMMGQAGRSFAAPPRKSRAESYFGVHFDLHPNAKDTVLGRDVTEEMVGNFLSRVKPDFVQYDCKGHPGWMGYKSKVQKSPPIVRDSLAVWRKVTAERGVSLYIHFSGIWDYLAAEEHPDWAARHADGSPDSRAMSTFGPYVDQLMIPELVEAAITHDLDGAWVDGDCWGVIPDYGDACAAEFRKKTGMTALPKSASDPGWREFLEVNREGFRRYVTKYVDTLHAKKPGFQIASNWLYSTFVPEKPQIPVDYLSGDYAGNSAISTARLEARYLQSTGRTWDLMAWGFQSDRSTGAGAINKSAEQLQQEACIVLAQGGAFQVYYQPTRAGYIDELHIDTMARLAEFVRKREAACHHSEAVPQIGVVFSQHSIYSTAKKPFGSWGSQVDPARGLIDALLENQYSADIIPDWKIDEAGRYPLVVVPEWPDLSAETARALIGVAESGGSLFVAGAENARLFQDALGIQLTGTAGHEPAFIPGKEVFANVSGQWQEVQPGSAQVVLTRFPTFDSTKDGKTAATLNSVGKGRIIGFYGDAGTVFAKTHAPEVRHVIGGLVSRLFQPKYRVSAPPTVEVALRRKHGREYLHLINTTGVQIAADYSVINFVPPVGPIIVRGAVSAKPLYEQAGITRHGTKLTIPTLRQYEVLEIE